MAVEVFSLVTARIDDKFLSYVVSSTGRDRDGVEQLLCGMSSNLQCWQKDDGSWHISGCLNNVVEAGANLLALYMRSQAAARSCGGSTADAALSVSGADDISAGTPPPFVAKTESVDDDDDDSDNIPLQDRIQKEAASQIQPETDSVDVGRKKVVSASRPQTRQSTSLAARKQSPKSYCCRVCKKSFSSSTNLRRHVRANHETGRFQCQYCPVAFKRCDSLLRHRRTAHADLQCTGCRKVFRNVDSKSAHVCKGRSSNKLSCTVCSKSFISRSNLNKHIRMTHGAIVFPCKECGKVFRHSDTLTLHTWKSHQRFICPQCGSVHETANLLCKHMSSVHGKRVPGMSAMRRSPSTENGDDSMNMNDVSDGDDDATDNLASDFLAGAADGGEHSLMQVLENGEASFLDVISDADELLRANVRKNRVKEEPGTRSNASNSKQAPGGAGKSNACHVCNKSFSSESNLRRHIRVNHEASQFPCHMCSAVFKRIDSLVRHKRANHADLCCSACHSVFNSAEAKATHDCLLPSEKKLSCDVCGKSFVNRSNLNKHSYLVHGGVKFHCTECPKFFRRSMTLTLHMWKFHNRFNCPQCNAVLDTAALLCEHMSSVHGRKATKNLSEICRRPVARPIPVANCTRCNKTFSSRSNLAKHVRVVHGHPRWHCALCERTFTAELQLSLHIRTFHQHLPMKLVAFTALIVAPSERINKLASSVVCGKFPQTTLLANLFKRNTNFSGISAGNTAKICVPLVNLCRFGVANCLQCFDIVGWAAGRASGP